MHPTKEEESALDADLDGAVRLARNARPRITIDSAAFKVRLAEILRQQGSLPNFVPDLYLATACLQSDAEALASFDEEFMVMIPRFVSHLGLSNADVDDLAQGIRIRLLMPPAPKLASYLGSAPLAAWLRVVAARAGLHALRSLAARPRVSLGQIEALVATGQEELGSLLERHREDLKRVLENVLQQLEPSQKTLLRLHVVDGQNFATIAGIYGVHRATIARRIAAIRKQALDELRRTVAVGLGSSSTEVRSLIEYLGGDLALSVSRVLGRERS